MQVYQRCSQRSKQCRFMLPKRSDTENLVSNRTAQASLRQPYQLSRYQHYQHVLVLSRSCHNQLTNCVTGRRRRERRPAPPGGWLALQVLQPYIRVDSRTARSRNDHPLLLLCMEWHRVQLVIQRNHGRRASEAESWAFPQSVVHLRRRRCPGRTRHGRRRHGRRE